VAAVVPRGVQLGAALPLLRLYCVVGGSLVEPDTAAWSVYDVGDDDKLLQPVLRETGQVEAVTDVLAAGAYAADWLIPADEPLGRHEVRWVFEYDGASYAYREEFDVAPGVVGGAFRSYALPSDLRREGACDGHTEARIQRALGRAAETIDKLTNRFFEPRALALTLDGTGGPALRFGFPVLAVASVAYVGDYAADVPLERVVAYNRWLTEGMVLPDDRDDPRVALMPDGYDLPRYRALPRNVPWRSGRRNVRVSGLFGYTDPDGSPVGKTPDAIAEVCKMLALRDLPGLYSGADERDAERARGRLLSETTRDQSRTYGADPRLAAAGWTGDPDIDAVLARYAAPPFVGST
jgi:hypothetical protein